MINKKLGIIGYGSMGSMLLNGFADSNMIKPSDIMVSTRTKEKLINLKNNRITICSSNAELTQKCDLIFICVKPLEVKNILDEILKELNQDKHIISIAGSLTISNIEKIYSGKISRVLPTLISEVKAGVTLICHNSQVLSADKEILERLLNTMSNVKEIPESEFELVSDLTSYAPGLIASIFREYVNSAALHTSMSKKEITGIVTQTLAGTVKLFCEKNFDFDTTIKRVATKGGATEAGVRVLEDKLPEVFNAMFNQTLERQEARKQKIDEQFPD